MNVLSLDFDYFQKTSGLVIATYYPTPDDMSTSLANSEWMMYYSDPKTAEKLSQIELMESDYDKVRKLIRNIGSAKPDTPAMVVNSHELLYDFVNEHMKSDKDELNIVNLDTHHDVFHPENESVNCGNWVLGLKRLYKNMKTVWVKNQYSSDFYMQFIPDDEQQLEAIDQQITDVDVLFEYDYDMIFLCRSDAFLVPSLDIYFEKLYTQIDDSFNDVFVEEDVRNVRNILDMVRSRDRVQQELTQEVERKI